MKILPRYILREARPPFIFGFSIFTFILLMDELFTVLELAINRGVAAADAARLLLYSVPATMAITVPMALLLGVLLALGRLSQDNEIIALRANGISFYWIITPLVLLGLFLSVFMVLFNDIVLPYGNYAYKKLYVEIVRRKAEIIIQPGRFINDFDNNVLYVEKVDNQNGKLQNILIFQNVPDAPLRTIMAKRGKLVSDPNSGMVSLLLEEGQLQAGDPKDPAVFLQATFASHSLFLDINSVLDNSRDVRKSAREMTIREIRTNIKKHQGVAKKQRPFLVELHKKISIPFACLTFVLIGAPLGIQSRRSGKGAGFSISLILIFVYYLLIMCGQILGENGTLAAGLAMWLPNLVLGGVGLYLIYHTAQEVEMRFLQYWRYLPFKYPRRDS